MAGRGGLSPVRKLRDGKREETAAAAAASSPAAEARRAAAACPQPAGRQQPLQKPSCPGPQQPIGGRLLRAPEVLLIMTSPSCAAEAGPGLAVVTRQQAAGPW